MAMNPVVKPGLKKKILLVEDDPYVNEVLGYRLRSLDFEVLIAQDGEAGLKKAGEKFPDLIILDLMLPKLSGEQLCKNIREHQDKKFSKIPIIMLTGKTSDVDRVIGRVIGANSYVTKPFDIENLLKEINRLIL
jgi:DNA-binding response OmpR family regulator